jgi:mono/diheme cytochrome c family protein
VRYVHRMRTHPAAPLLLAFAALWACATPSATPSPARSAVASSRPPQVTDSTIALGRLVYNGRGNCRSCHGDEGQGTARGPALRDNIRVAGDSSFSALVTQVFHGTPARGSAGRSMPSRQDPKLTYSEVRAVAAYVWSLRERS